MAEKKDKLSPEELDALRVAFKTRLAEKDIKQGKWAIQNGLDPNTLSQIINGSWQTFPDNRYLKKVRRFIRS